MKSLYGIVAASIFATCAHCEDLKTAMAKNLSADPTFLVINIPPRPEVWPGAVFTLNLRFPIRRGDSNDPALRKGLPIAISADEDLHEGASAGGGIASWFGLKADVVNDADVSISFPDVRVVDMDLPSLLKRIKETPEVTDAAKKGIASIVVIKCYEGLATITIRKKAGAKTESWARVKANAEARAGASILNGDSLIFKGSAPIVFAFETAQIDVDPSSINSDSLSFRLANLPSINYLERQAAVDYQIDKQLRAVAGISIADIQSHGVFGGPNSFFGKPFGQ